MHTIIISKTILISFLITTLNVNICEVLSQNESEKNSMSIIPAAAEQKKNGTQFQLFKKLSVPSGTSLSLTAQVSRPKILPGVFLVDDAVILDAVVELPMWMDVDRFVDAMYHDGGESEEERPRSKDDMNFSDFIGKERCFLYQNLEHFISSLMTISRSTSHACLRRAVCEIHKIAAEYNNTHPPSLMFELIELFFTPSFGKHDACNLPYLRAESMGKVGICHKYISKCPINIASLIMKRLVPSFLH